MVRTRLSPRLALYVAVAAIVLCAACMPAAAQAAVGLRIQPVKISETLGPGQSASGVITLTNASDVPVEVSMTAQDFIPLAGADSIQFVDRVEGVTSVKDWILLPGDRTFSFDIGETRQIPYSITAPQNAEPGGHFGVVFFKAVDAKDEGTLQVGTQVGMLVLVAVPGNHLQKGVIRSFEAPSFVEGGPVEFKIEFENTGTVHFEPKGEIAIRNMFGSVVARVPVDGQIVLPTSIKTLTEQWSAEGILLGRYSADVTLVDGEGETLTTDSVSFWAFPTWYVLGFIALALAIFFLLRFLKRRVRISIDRN